MGKDFGVLSNALKFEYGLSINSKEELLNILIIVLVVFLMIVLFKYLRKFIVRALIVGTISLMCVSCVDMIKINSSICELSDAAERAKTDVPSFSFSKQGQNVIVLMMDRAMNEYVPYIMNEKPELKEQFSGFTYYSNTVSFGGFTNLGTPALYGGYEYTPSEMNKRDTESLASKHTEAIKVMPVLFDQNGYNVTVCDPTYTNYQYKTDLSVYDDYPNINKYTIAGRFTNLDEKKETISNNMRNFFCYGIMKTVPLCIQTVFYDHGKYNQGQNTNLILPKVSNIAFMDAYSTLENLSNLTNISEGNDNTFLLMTNDTTHEPVGLQEPDYTPLSKIDNDAYEAENSERFTLDGKVLSMENQMQLEHYQVNMAAFLKIGEWLDYLRENDVYDNTRIIIVADHGRALHHDDSMEIDNDKKDDEDSMYDIYNTEFYYPLLMVKDFNSTEFTTSEEFMTNGDVPSIAVEGIIDNAVNPFTGKELNNNEKYAHAQYVLGSLEYKIDINNGNTFLPGTWFSVHTDMRKKENWSVNNENGVLPIEN